MREVRSWWGSPKPAGGRRSGLGVGEVKSGRGAGLPAASQKGAEQEEEEGKQDGQAEQEQDAQGGHARDGGAFNKVRGRHAGRHGLSGAPGRRGLGVGGQRG